MYYADLQTVVKVTSTDADGHEITETLKDLTSGRSGAFWVGRLPYGTYYLHETAVPDGYSASTASGNWFILTVNENGVGYEQASGTLRNRLDPEAAKPEP